ncbi:MAG: hypothetical protein N2645_07500 [Clostridia bacterium]|nr:hypothetical protein [Clostridia bacterium]
MLYCKYCNYLKKVGSRNESQGPSEFICEFTNYVFTEEIEELNIDYPCNNPNKSIHS